MLVAILAIVVLSAVVILRVTTSTFMASANRQLNQDQAYELAASLGSSIDELIADGKYSLDDIDSEKVIYTYSNFSGLPDASVEARIVVKPDVKILRVTSQVGKAQYVYTKEYLP